MAGKHRSAERVPVEAIPCAYQGCADRAVIWRKGAKICAKHDLFQVQLEADEFVRRLELHKREQKAEWCRRTLKSAKPTPYEHWLKVSQTPGLLPIAYEMARNFLKSRAIAREPGQDDEEVAA